MIDSKHSTILLLKLRFILAFLILGFALYKYNNGISFVKTNAAEVNGFARRQIVITGTNGSMEINPIETIEKDTERDHWMTAEEALAYGLIDGIMDKRK